jgi:aspartate-semialdehyde dehydrogenase
MVDRLVVVGATGLIGSLVLSMLEERAFPVDKVDVVATKSSKGKKLAFRGEALEVGALSEYDFSEATLALFCVPTDVSVEYVPIAAKAGCVVVDNSNHWRTDPEVPLLIPEINCHEVAGYVNKNIIANANCATIQMLMAVKPLHDLAKIKRIVVATYQSVSGIGKHAMDELVGASEKALKGEDHTPKKFPKDIAFNVLPQVDSFRDDGRTVEEWKIQHDTSKILGEEIPVSATCVRVPVSVGHAEAVNVEFTSPISVEEARKALADASGVVLDDADGNFTVPRDIAGTDPVFVSRIRKDHTVENGLNLWVVADNLRKGAALNTVQIAECWLEHVASKEKGEAPKTCSQ